MSTEEQAQQQPNPSELAGQVKVCRVLNHISTSELTGRLCKAKPTPWVMLRFSASESSYQAIGSVLPEGQAESWIKSGEELQRDGQTEINNAKQKQAVESAVDGASAKIKS
jgi:hypothetical protein